MNRSNRPNKGNQPMSTGINLGLMGFDAAETGAGSYREILKKEAARSRHNRAKKIFHPELTETELTFYA